MEFCIFDENAKWNREFNLRSKRNEIIMTRSTERWTLPVPVIIKMTLYKWFRSEFDFYNFGKCYINMNIKDNLSLLYHLCMSCIQCSVISLSYLSFIGNKTKLLSITMNIIANWANLDLSKCVMVVLSVWRSSNSRNRLVCRNRKIWHLPL